MRITVITNNLGSGDYVMVVRGSEVIFENHRVWPKALVDILSDVKGYDEVRFVELTDEQMENWQAHI